MFVLSLSHVHNKNVSFKHMRLFQITIVTKSGMCVCLTIISHLSKLKKKLKKVLVVVKVAAV